MHRQLDDKTLVNGQIAPEDVPALKEMGVTLIVNNRPDGEDVGQPESDDIEAAGLADTWALAGDTDGIDGSEDNAGAVLAPDSLARALSLGLDAKRMLADNDGYGFFAALGDLVVTGPTRTNVNDYRVILLR